MAGNARSLTRNANQLCFNLLSVNLSLHTFSNTLCTRGAPPKAKLLLRKRRHTPRELYCRRPHPRLAHVPALWRDHRRHRHALLGSAVAMDRREGLALRPRPAGLLALAGKPVWNTRAASQSTSAHRPRLAEADGRPRESSLWRWRRVCWRAHGQTHWPRPLGGCSRLGGQTTSGWRRAGRA